MAELTREDYIRSGADPAMATAVSGENRDATEYPGLKVRIEEGLNVIGGTFDAGPWWTSSLGVDGETVSSADMSGADAPVTDAPALTKKLVITDVEISVDTAMRVDLKEETTGKVIGRYYLPANSTMQITPRGKKKLSTANKRLLARTSAAGNVAITVNYFSES